MRMCGIGAEVGAGALDAGPVARPGLGGGIPRFDEEREGRAAVVAQHRDGVRMVEAGQVVEVAVLAKRVVGVVRATREPGADEDRHGAGLHRREHAPSSGFVHARRIPASRGSAAADRMQLGAASRDA